MVMLTSRALIFFSLLLCASIVKADQYVFSYDGPDVAYQIFRNEKKLSLSLFQGLLAGDKVVVRSKRYTITLADVSGEKLVVGHNNSPYIVPESGAAPGELDNFLFWANTAFLELKGDEDISRVNLVSRSGSGSTVFGLSLPSSDQSIAEGRKEVHFSTRGIQPMQMEVSTSDETLVAETESAGQGLMKVQLSVPLGQVSAIGSVQIIPTSIENIPSCPFGGIKDSSAACAIWLMHLEQGQYFLEALNQLIELSTAQSDYLIRVVLLRQKES
jgi:hypothetical protein